MSNIIAYPCRRRSAETSPETPQTTVRATLSQSALDLESALENLRCVPVGPALSAWRDHVSKNIAALIEDTRTLMNVVPAEARPIEDVLARLNHLRVEVARLLSAHSRRPAEAGRAVETGVTRDSG